MAAVWSSWLSSRLSTNIQKKGCRLPGLGLAYCRMRWNWNRYHTGGGGRCVWEVPGEGTRRRGEPEGLGGQGCLREGHSGVAGLALGPHLLPRAGLSSPERLSLKAPGSVWPRAQSPASPNAPH